MRSCALSAITEVSNINIHRIFFMKFRILSAGGLSKKLSHVWDVLALSGDADILVHYWCFFLMSTGSALSMDGQLPFACVHSPPLKNCVKLRVMPHNTHGTRVAWQ
jgi:hypothetical protein